MQSLVAFAALLAAVNAIPAPAPQLIDFSDPSTEAIVSTPGALTGPPVGAFSQPDVYNPTKANAVAASAIASKPLTSASRTKGLRKGKGSGSHKRGVNDPCAPQPSSASPPVGDNSTPQSFQSSFANLGSNLPVPSGYSSIFTNAQASTSEVGYLGLYPLDSYDPQACATLCDNKDLCFAFNIYVERDPSLNPAAGSSCSNPPPITNVKCTLYGMPISANTATNSGETRASFQIVIAGSNGYQKIPVPDPIPGFTLPVNVPGAINAPLAADGSNTYMGYKLFPSDPFNPAQCATACLAQNAYNVKHHASTPCSYQACVSFIHYPLVFLASFVLQLLTAFNRLLSMHMF